MQVNLTLNESSLLDSEIEQLLKGRIRSMVRSDKDKFTEFAEKQAKNAVEAHWTATHAQFIRDKVQNAIRQTIFSPTLGTARQGIMVDEVISAEMKSITLQLVEKRIAEVNLDLLIQKEVRAQISARLDALMSLESKLN